MIIRIVLITLLTVAWLLPAVWAGEKRIKHQVITRLDGHVYILMPCNWLPGERMSITGKYGEALEARPMPNTRLEYSQEPLKPGTNRYVEMVIGEADRAGLNEAILEFKDSKKQCPGDIGQRNFTQ